MHEHARVCSAVECDTERLEAFLTGRVPNLQRHQLIIDHDFLRQEIGTDGRLVLVAETLMHILIHQRGLADAEQRHTAKERKMSHSLVAASNSRPRD